MPGQPMADPSVEIRPGVFRPDWSAITRHAARKALLGRMTARAGLLDRWSCSLEPDQDLVWRTTLQLYAKYGRAPSTIELAADADIAVDRLTDLLAELDGRDQIGFERATARIRWAYPFTEANTGHRVELNGQTLRALCAIDALGVAAMYRADTTITSPCRHCGTTVSITTAAAGRALAHVYPSDATVWYDFAYEGRAAASCCPSIAFFCSAAHLQSWKDSSQAPRVGIALSMDEALELGRAIFGPVLAPLDPRVPFNAE
jgi:alkylmercury lyase